MAETTTDTPSMPLDSATKIEEAQRRYRQKLDGGRRVQKNYEASEKGKATTRRYQSSEGYKLSKRKWSASQKGQAYLAAVKEKNQTFRELEKQLRTNPEITVEDLFNE